MSGTSGSPAGASPSGHDNKKDTGGAGGTGSAAGLASPVASALGFVHHVAIICSDYARSRRFYVETLGLGVLAETYRQERDSWKLDLSVGGRYAIELFSFTSPPPRQDAPEAAGLRHLAFGVVDLAAARGMLEARGVALEDLRVDPITGKRYCFFKDPDGLPLELYEAQEAPGGHRAGRFRPAQHRAVSSAAQRNMSPRSKKDAP